MSRKKAILSEPKQTSVATLRNSTKSDTRPRRPAREHLKSSVLEELWSIWRADPRVPSVRSRRSWAISRNANPRLVDNWFLRRRTCAKKAGQPLPTGSYDLPLDQPIVPPREHPATPVEPELELPSDDTLDDDLNDLQASSDTAYDEDTFIELRGTNTSAYKEVPQQPRPKHHHFQPKPSSADVHAAENRCDGDTLFENPSSRVCNQSLGEPSKCMVCSRKSVQGTADEIVSDSDSNRDLTAPYPRLDFSPDTLSELSAIPFLFRTPLTVPVSHSTVNDWTIVEDELERLVNDGKLDFSFLDVPDLASMELLD